MAEPDPSAAPATPSAPRELREKMDRLERENARLQGAVQELSILNDIATAVTSTSSLNEIVDLIVQKSVEHLGVEQGAVLLFEDQEQSALKTMIRKVDTERAAIPYRLSDQIIGWMLKHRAPLVIADLASDTRFMLPAEASSIRSLMCVPLMQKGKMIGVINVFNKRSAEGFTGEDRRLLSIIAAQSTQVIENARLYEQEQALAKIRQELQVASEIQLRLLPKEPPRLDGYDIAGRSIPAQNVGGDLFDYLSVEGRVALSLGDVSGKGMPAALLMAHVQATMRSQSLMNLGPAECLSHCNRVLSQNTDPDKFVTLFYAVLNTATGELRYSNGGHNPGLLLAEGKEAQLLSEGGPVLGVLPAFTFEESAVQLEPGQLLAIYSDGISEAENERDEEFGEDRLRDIIAAHAREPAQTIIDRVFQAVRQHAGAAPQFDDMTMVVVRARR